MGQETDFADGSLLRWLSVWVLVWKMYMKLWSADIIYICKLHQNCLRNNLPEIPSPPLGVHVCLQSCVHFANNFFFPVLPLWCLALALWDNYTNTQRELHTVCFWSSYICIFLPDLCKNFTESVWRPVKILLCTGHALWVSQGQLVDKNAQVS